MDTARRFSNKIPRQISMGLALRRNESPATLAETIKRRLPTALATVSIVIAGGLIGAFVILVIILYVLGRTSVSTLTSMTRAELSGCFWALTAICAMGTGIWLYITRNR